MIVLNDEDQRQLGKSTDFITSNASYAFPAVPAPAASSQLVSHLPNYEASEREARYQRQHRRYHDLESIAPVNTPPRGSGKFSLEKRINVRVWWAVRYVIIAYIALSTICGVPYIVFRLSRKLHDYPPRPLAPHPEWGVEDDEYLVPDNVGVLAVNTLARCNEWMFTDDRPKHSSYFASSTFTLPTDGKFSVISNTSHLAPKNPWIGNLTVDINPDLSETDVRFNVGLQSSSSLIRDQTQICFYPSGADKGLHLYLPDDINDTLQIDIRLLFPQTAIPLDIKKLFVSLPNFAQYFGDLEQHITFHKIIVRGSNADIHFDSIAARELMVKNELAAVVGSFNVSNVLHIDTIEGPIRTNITLVHIPSHIDKPVYMSLDTGNADIDAQVTFVHQPSFSLFKPHPDASPLFTADLKTYSASLAASFLHAPSSPPAPVHLRMQNNMGPTNLTLDTKFQGLFDLQSKLSEVTVVEGQLSAIEDASTREGESMLDKLMGSSKEYTKSRTFTYEHSSLSRKLGWVGETDKVHAHASGPGTVEIASSREPVHLDFIEAVI